MKSPTALGGCPRIEAVARGSGFETIFSIKRGEYWVVLTPNPSGTDLDRASDPVGVKYRKYFINLIGKWANIRFSAVNSLFSDSLLGDKNDPEIWPIKLVYMRLVNCLNRELARISHRNDKPSLDLCSHKELSSLGKTIRIPLDQKTLCENKSLRGHLASGEKCRLED